MNVFFEKIMKPIIVENKYTDICEIGAQYGRNTNNLLGIHSVRSLVIDPCIDADLCKKYEKNENLRICEGLSLEILSKISEQFDCFLIDGDHNWYTVYNELKTIHQKDLLKRGGAVFLHDVSWPYGRRDLYYNPDSIPKEFRHPYAKQGIRKGEVTLVNNGDERVCAHLNNAVYEGGPRNGVLTAVEDFLKEYGKDYLFFVLHKQYGLAVLIRRKNIITIVKFIKWLLKVRFYEHFLTVEEFIKVRMPFVYRLYLSAITMLNVKVDRLNI